MGWGGGAGEVLCSLLRGMRCDIIYLFHTIIHTSDSIIKYFGYSIGRVFDANFEKLSCKFNFEFSTFSIN